MFIWKKLKWLFEKFYAFGKGYQLYSASEIIIRLQGQLNIDAGLVNQKWQPNVKTVTYVKCINDICINDTRSGWLSSVPDKQ